MDESSLRGLSTRKARRAFTLTPSILITANNAENKLEIRNFKRFSVAKVQTYPIMTMVKSSMFHVFFRYAF